MGDGRHGMAASLPTAGQRAEMFQTIHHGFSYEIELDDYDYDFKLINLARTSFVRG